MPWEASDTECGGFPFSKGGRFVNKNGRLFVTLYKYRVWSQVTRAEAEHARCSDNRRLRRAPFSWRTLDQTGPQMWVDHSQLRL